MGEPGGLPSYKEKGRRKGIHRVKSEELKIKN